MKSVGIDIGSSSIKVVEVVSNNKGVQLTKFIEHSLGQNPAFDPEIEIIEFLRNLFVQYDQSSTRFVMGLRQDRVSVRNKIFPFSDRQKILKSLPFELEEDLPFSSETAVYDAKLVRTVGNSSELLACATPKHRIEQALKLAQDAGVELHVLSSEGIALANCIENWDQAPPAVPAQAMALEGQEAPERHITILLNLGHTRSLVCAFENNQLIGVRSILWGGKNLADALAKKYEIPYIEAMKELATKAFFLPNKDGASYDQVVFSDTLSTSLKELGRELKISILEFKSEFNGIVDGVGISGGVSNMLNLHAFLTQQLELPVNRVELLRNFSQVQFERTVKSESVIGVALGLAIEGLKKPRNPALNFLRGDFARQNHAAKIFWEKWGSFIQVSAAAFVVFLVYSIVRESTTQSLAYRTEEALTSQAKAVAKLNAKTANEAGIKKYIREQRKVALQLKTLSGLSRMNSAMDILKKVSDSAPNNKALTLNVKKFSVKDNMVQIEGTVAHAGEASLLKKSLSNVAIDGKIQEAPATITAPSGSTAFSFEFKVDRGMSTN